jgi:hypothetical protein
MKLQHKLIYSFLRCQYSINWLNWSYVVSFLLTFRKRLSFSRIFLIYVIENMDSISVVIFWSLLNSSCSCSLRLIHVDVSLWNHLYFHKQMKWLLHFEFFYFIYHLHPQDTNTNLDTSRTKNNNQNANDVELLLVTAYKSQKIEQVVL